MTTPSTQERRPSRRLVRAALWAPGLAVALGAAVATAHGLYEVAAAAAVPAGIAWLYPLITDGLALVAYIATARLTGSAARYAWAVVALAAGLSGLAQAVYLAGGAALDAPPVLRFGVGAWPAGAAAIVAHLLYLLATDDPGDAVPVPTAGCSPSSALPTRVSNRPAEQTVHRPTPAAVQPPAARPALTASVTPSDQAGTRPARERARIAAARYARDHNALPTVSGLATLAGVSRGTAATALQDLRNHPAPLHLITTSTENDDDTTIEEQTQR